MANEERITYDQVKQQGIRSAKIIVTKSDYKNDIFLELEKDGVKKQIGKDIDTVSLYGVLRDPQVGGPFFITVIDQGILNIYEEVLYKVTENIEEQLKLSEERLKLTEDQLKPTKDHSKSKNMRIYVPIW